MRFRMERLIFVKKILIKGYFRFELIEEQYT